VTRVDVLADGATLEQDVDRAAAQEAQRAAQSRLDAGDESARPALARAEALLNLSGGPEPQPAAAHGP
jgi:F0F1-type ATP synthase epsilon subunit